MYVHYKKVVFPKVLEDPLVQQEDKRKIRDLLKKKWNPHARRHTSATEISKVIKDPVLIDNYFGWSHKGNTRLKYQHYFPGDTIDAMLTVMDGLPLSSQTEQNKQKNLLKPKQCPNCTENNTSESKFCVKCKFVLSFDLYNETLEEKAKTAKEAEETKKVAAFESRQTQFEESILKNLDQNQKWMLELLEPHLKQIKDEKERSKERLSFLMQVPRLMRQMDGDGDDDDDREEDKERIKE